MAKEITLQSVGHACTRIVSIRADLIREFLPNATKDTKIKGEWEVDKGKGGLFLKFYEKSE
jgi:hypothetical protein